ncbi:hypothetical protein [Arundinibacter roseus]|uniref:Uncharacterized protein n=1 Tax=Arundinibacter roseus TaxID=2070510 RepID=A0A4R4K7X8_9BACT|nr:hypothetical protein [Arundinibacter roseus]TDB63777.1 hypothetical protein EZE20_15920 [Arundinibacter roseus]
MGARQQLIYEVRIRPLVQANPFEMPEETITYFSNLKKAIETIHTALGAQRWPSTINYSGVYRNLKSRGKFRHVFVVEGVRYFELNICTRLLNPHLTTLGIDEMPAPRRK